MALSRNNEILVSGGCEPELQLNVLNPRAAQQPCRFYTHSNHIGKVYFTADRKRVVLLVQSDSPQLIILKAVHV